MVTGRVWQNVLFFSQPKSMGFGRIHTAIQSIAVRVVSASLGKGNQIQFEHQQKYAFKVWD